MRRLSRLVPGCCRQRSSDQQHRLLELVHTVSPHVADTTLRTAQCSGVYLISSSCLLSIISRRPLWRPRASSNWSRTPAAREQAGLRHDRHHVVVASDVDKLQAILWQWHVLVCGSTLFYTELGTGQTLIGAPRPCALHTLYAMICSNVQGCTSHLVKGCHTCSTS